VVSAPISAPPASPVSTNGFFVRDGDIWVMVGDSITWQNLYTVYLEAFIRARYPGLAFVTVNSGKSGEVYIQGIIRFRDTIAAYKPTLVTVNYGMNDHTKIFPGEQNFLENPRSAPQRLVEAVQGTGARLLMFSASPLLAPADYATDGGKFQLTGQNGDGKTQPGGWRSNPVNRQFADQLRQLAVRNQVPFVDQMTALQEIWGSNYPRDCVATMLQALRGSNTLTIIKPYLGNQNMVDLMPLPDKENLMRQWRGLKGSSDAQQQEFQTYLQGWMVRMDKATPPFIRVSGYTGSSRSSDLIHPNEAGHLCMAGVLLKLLNADGLVSEVVLDAKTLAVVSAKKAVVRDLSFKEGILSFKRLDEALPFPVDPLARPALDLNAPSSAGNPKDLFGLSRYLLTVEHLPSGSYEIAIDGEVVAVTTAEQLANGFDAGLLEKGPIAKQCQRVLEAVRANSIMACVGKGEPPPRAVGKPRTFAEAQPVEHVWTIKPIDSANRLR
jgi:lysophospholipase L1-like esterase